MNYIPYPPAGPIMRAYLVEIRPGTGIWVNNVLFDGSAPNGPWNWPVPFDVAVLEKLMGQAPGGGGGAGYNATTQRPGGGGGGDGQSMEAENWPVVPGSTLSITIGSVGQGAPLGGTATNAGNVQIDGLWNPAGPTINRILLTGGLAGTSASPTVGGTGGYGGLFLSGGPGAGGAVSTVGGSASATEAVVASFRSLTCGGAGGGGAGSAGNVAGANGGTVYPPAFAFNASLMMTAGNLNYGSPAGNTDGTNSYGAGGNGGLARFGQPGLGGAGNVAGTTGAGYGGGGGGGGGNKPGANGSPGWVAFSYRSAL